MVLQELEGGLVAFRPQETLGGVSEATGIGRGGREGWGRGGGRIQRGVRLEIQIPHGKTENRTLNIEDQTSSIESIE